jgi:hypothetical protein
MAGAMSLVCRAKHFLPKNIRVLLYKLFINFHLDYCNLLWGSASQSLLKPLVSMQKKAICLALNAPYNSHTDPLFAEINSLKFEDQYQLNASNFANQIIEGEAHWRVSSSFKIIKPDKDSRHPKCTTLFVPTCRTNATQRMCSYTIPTIFAFGLTA